MTTKRTHEEMAMRTMRGDLRSALLDRFKHTQKPWQQMTEPEQREYANYIDRLAGRLVEQAVQLAAAQGNPASLATLKGFQPKPETSQRSALIEAKLLLDGQDSNRHELFDHIDQKVVIGIVDLTAGQGERASINEEWEPVFRFSDTGEDDDGEDDGDVDIPERAPGEPDMAAIAEHFAAEDAARDEPMPGEHPLFQ